MSNKPGLTQKAALLQTSLYFGNDMTDFIKQLTFYLNEEYDMQLCQLCLDKGVYHRCKECNGYFCEDCQVAISFCDCTEGGAELEEIAITRYLSSDEDATQKDEDLNPPKKRKHTLSTAEPPLPIVFP